MASAEIQHVVPVPDASQDVNTQEKVTTIPNLEHDETASTSTTLDGNSHPENLKAAFGDTHGGDMDGAKLTNGDSKTYAAALASTGSEEQASRRKGDIADNKNGGSPYPTLAMQGSFPSHEKEAWEMRGIRFAPLSVPLFRRLQTAAILFHCTSIILFVSCFWFTCANPLTWPLLVPYLVHLTVSSAATNGNLAYRSEYLRSLPLWKLFAGYFPAKLHKTHELSPKRKYIFGYHPHGIISHGAWCAFATNALGFAEKFPGITNTLLTLDSNFRLPFYRDWILAMGLRSVSKESIWNTLSKGGPRNDGEGRAVTIVIGGARESLEAQPGTLRLILQNRKGFVKMALRTGADLVPVIGFGENDLYDQLSPKTHPMVHKVQMFVLKVFKFTVPALHGRGLLNYDVGFMPYRRAVNIVVGRPIEVGKSHGPQPEQAEIDRVHELYVAEVEQMWERYKDQFASSRKEEMQIIS